ncbi:hypothetical protein HG535_0E04110 [Zygotorulaspora mrakii]|uniref:Mediator of RNA polymerase II transcription subunit 3 n=1 Tax=Zygotorulaspora mrakii TaxID=42260 RepID=A0A7H9B463_ZYGMR|nr:uncharacterized protein HG535_0E04110 [Zygotorulaspora mrakii]QLG73327.1 hypothetical protein HG535_0E04110 [Zygotorulaspora mrakii]
MPNEGIGEMLTPNIKLEELESKLVASDGDCRDKVMGSIDNTQKAILPMRLLFNDFIQSMSNVDNLGGENPKENFLLIRSKVLELSTRVQVVADDFNKLQPLFETISEYSTKHGDKKYQPLETLKSFSPNGGAITNNVLSGANVNGIAANINSTSVESSTKKYNRSNNGTPINASTPGSSTPTSAVPPAKKPRKPRQSKKAIAANSKNQTHPSAISGTPAANGMGSTPNASMPVISVPPTNMMASPPLSAMMSPMAPANFAATPQSQAQSQPQQQPQQQPQSQAQLQAQTQSQVQVPPVPQSQQALSQAQQQRQQRQFSPPLRNNAASQSHLNMNNITPANILNMSMTREGQHVSMQPQQAQQPPQPQ